MATNYKFGYNGNPVDFDDYFVRLDLFATGNLWGWGYNLEGQLGDNTIVDKSSPVQTVAGGNYWKEVSSGSRHSAGIKSDGTLWSWGTNEFGALGDGTVVQKNYPVEINANTVQWKKVSCGNDYSCGIKIDGSLWTWGRNAYGQLGTNDLVHRSSAVQTNAGGFNWKECDSGYQFMAAIKTDGTLWTWGRNQFYGQLGLGDTSDRIVPTQVGTDVSWKNISCGQNHAAAIKTDGTLWCWGRGQYGQLGNNSALHRSSPVQENSGGTNWKKVKCGYFHTMGIKTDGSLWLWGNNATYGALGDFSTTNKSVPVETVFGGKVWKDVSGGDDFTTAIKIDGTLWCWGTNALGQLGNNDNLVTSVSSPILMHMNNSAWKNVASGRYSAFAIRYLDAP